MRRSLRWLIATAGASLALAIVLPAGALAASQPSIEWTSAWSLTTTDATVGAGIDVENLEHGAYYQFQVVTNTSEYLSEIACPPRAKLKGTDGCGPGPEVEGALPIGFIPSNAVGPARTESVSLDLASAGVTLKPGTTYHYRVLAARRVQTEDTLQWEPPVVVGPDQTFTTPAAEAPTVEAESASHLTSTDATLEATINPQAAERGALYQFQLVTEQSKYLTEFTCPAAHQVFCALEGRLSSEGEEGLPLGTTHAGVNGQGVSLDLAHAGVTLKPGTTYHYRIIAARFQQEEEGPGWEGPIVYGPDQTLTTPSANGPLIESVSVSHLTPSDATLEATIDTEGLSTSYEFQLWSSPCSHHGDGCELLIDIPLPTGLLLGSFVPQTVSLDLNSAGVKLEGGEYGFSVTAANKEGRATKSGGVFEPPEEAVVEPLGSIISPTPTGPAPVISSGVSQSTGSSSSSSTTPGTSGTVGRAREKTVTVAAGGKPRAKHGKHHKRKHHGKKPRSLRRRA
jgi:hypothetical protein